MARRRPVDENQLSLQFTDEAFSSEAAREARPGRWVPMASSRVNSARYDPALEQVHVVFKDGTPWVYDGVPQNVWRNFRRSASPGKYINRVLNGYPYYRGSFDQSNEEDRA